MDLMRGSELKPETGFHKISELKLVGLIGSKGIIQAEKPSIRT